MLGSGLAAVLLLFVGPVMADPPIILFCIMGSIPRWGPKGNPTKGDFNEC